MKIILILVVLFLPGVVLAANMSSENFSVEGGDFNSGGTIDSASSNFSLNASFGEAIIGDSTSNNFQISAGFQNLIRFITGTPEPEVAPAPSVGGGGIIGGAAYLPSHINAFSVPLSIAPSQSGTLLQDFFDNHSARLEVPSAAVSVQTTFSITKRIVAPEAIQEIVAVDVVLISNDVFRVTAEDENGNPVTSFSKPLSITITIPDMPADLTDVGLYFLDTDALLWRLIPDAVFAADSVTFSVDHLTDFAIFRASGKPATLPLAQVPSACRGADFNTDGAVDLIDFGILIFFWNSAGLINPCVDVNSDGIVDLVDFGVLVFEWTG